MQMETKYKRVLTAVQKQAGGIFKHETIYNKQTA